MTFTLGCSTPKQTAIPQQERTKPLIQDDFSELDDDATVVDSNAVDTTLTEDLTDEYLNNTIESARQHYMNALHAQTVHDSVLCEGEFEHAIEVLNGLASYPDIEDDSNFVTLSKSIVEDYERYIQNINTLSPQSPMYVFRDKLAQEVESIPIDHAKPVPVPNEPMTLQVPMPQNDFVQQNIRFLAERLPQFTQRVLERSGKYFPMISRIFKEEGAPDELKYLAVIESALDPNSVSKARAVGMWQFMQATGAIYGLKINWWVDERRDPEKSTRAAAKFLLDRYHELHDWHCAIASYDCGPMRVIKDRGIVGDTNADFWKIRDYLPKETKNYVPLYIAAATIALNPRLYGFGSVVRSDPWQFDTVHMNEAVNLAAIAKCAGCPVEDISSLNPELMRGCTPPNVTDYILRIPAGSAKNFHTMYAQLSDDDKRVLLSHVVHRGESIRSIATAYGISPEDLASFNDFNVHKHLAAGTKLRVPVGSAALAAQAEVIQELHENDNVSRTAGRRIVHRVHSGETLASIANHYHVRLSDVRKWNNISLRRHSVPAGISLTLYIPGGSMAAASTKSANKKWVNVKVRRGETLAKIADEYNVTVQQVRAWNHGKRAAAGTSLKLFTAISPEEPAVMGKSLTHKVRSGETLAQIAGTYGVQESDLKEWNNIKGSHIIAGEKLRIYQTTETAKGDSRHSSAETSVYRVRSGDTLEKIARKFGETVSHLKSLNRNITDEKLRAGQKLIL